MHNSDHHEFHWKRPNLSKKNFSNKRNQLSNKIYDFIRCTKVFANRCIEIRIAIFMGESSDSARLAIVFRDCSHQNNRSECKFNVLLLPDTIDASVVSESLL